MRTVKKLTFVNGMDKFATKRMGYKEAIDDLELIFKKCSRKRIKEKLDKGTTLGNGIGTFYQVSTIRKTRKKGGKIMKKKEGNPAGKRTIWIDEKLHKKLKVLASKEGMKMGIFVEGLINQSLTKKGE